MNFLALGVLGYIVIILTSVLYHSNTFANTTNCVSYDNGAWITCTSDNGKQETIYITENN